MARTPRGHAKAPAGGGARARAGAGRARAALAGGGPAHAARLARLQAIRHVCGARAPAI